MDQVAKLILNIFNLIFFHLFINQYIKESMAKLAEMDNTTDEDEEEKNDRLDKIKGKSLQEVDQMKKLKKKSYTVIFNIFQVNFIFNILKILDKRFNDCW